MGLGLTMLEMAMDAPIMQVEWGIGLGIPMAAQLGGV